MTVENDLEDEIARPRDLDLSTSAVPINLAASPHATGRPRSELPEKITGLAELTAQQLREEWRRLYRSQPPRLSRDLLIRTIAYRMQELAYSGPSCGPLEAGRDLQEQLKPLGSQRGFQVGEAGDVPTRAVEPRDDATRDGSPRVANTIRMVCVSRWTAMVPGVVPFVTMMSGCRPTNSCASARLRLVSTTIPPNVHPHVAAFGPTQIRKRLSERGEARLNTRDRSHRPAKVRRCAASGRAVAPAPRSATQPRFLAPR
jgi:Protein of unknown function (DUF2924)